MKTKKAETASTTMSNSIFDTLISQAKRGAVFFDWYQMEKEQQGSITSYDVVIQRL